MAEIGPTLVGVWTLIVLGCNPTTASFSTVFCILAHLPLSYLQYYARFSMTHLESQRITQLQYLLPDLVAEEVTYLRSSSR